MSVRPCIFPSSGSDRPVGQASACRAPVATALQLCRCRRDAAPRTLFRMPTLDRITLYPVKSLDGVANRMDVAEILRIYDTAIPAPPQCQRCDTIQSVRCIRGTFR